MNLRRLDMRFADDEDKDDIEYLDHIYAFRKKGSTRITASEIETDCSSMTSRWLVLETPIPEENIVACGRLKFVNNSNIKCGIIDIIGVSGDISNQTQLYGQLLRHIEVILGSHGCRTSVIYVPQWREDLLQIFIQLGYEDLGGHEWPLENKEILLKPTMILEMQKTLILKLKDPKTFPASTASSIDVDINIDMNHNKDKDDKNITDANMECLFSPADMIQPEQGDEDFAMEGLMEDLFKALRFYKSDLTLLNLRKIAGQQKRQIYDDFCDAERTSCSSNADALSSLTLAYRTLHHCGSEVLFSYYLLQQVY
eukprot:gene4984-9960_t